MEGYPDIRIVAVPYDSAHPGLRMGAGPEHLLDNGLGEGLRSEGRGQGVTTVRHEREPTAEVATAFELHGLVSNQVRRALADGEFPLGLSGNCNTGAGRAPACGGARALSVHGLVSNRVRRALADGEFPLVLSGNCNTAAVGTLAGAGVE